MAKSDIVVISPHYCDMAQYLGGLALRWADQRKKVKNIVVFGTSSLCRPLFQIKGEELFQKINRVTSVRFEEEKQVMKILGAELRRFRLPDSSARGVTGLLSYMEDCRKLEGSLEPRVAELLEPEITGEESEVYIPCGKWFHVDHLIVKNAAISLLRKKKPKKVFGYSEQFPTGRLHENVGGTIYKISFEEKRELISNYSSQIINKIIRKMGSFEKVERLSIN